MITIGVFILSWVFFSLFGDMKRIPELFPTALFSSYLALFTDILMEKYELWSYLDPPLSGQGTKLFLGFGIYFVVAYLFIQYLPVGLWKQLIYTFIWVLFAIIFEYIYLINGIISHHIWWSMWISFFADWLIFGMIYLQYSFYSKVNLWRIV